MQLPETVTWITTNLSQTSPGVVALGDIKVGESRTFDVVVAPPEDTEFGDHSDKFVISGTNSEQELEIGVYVLVTSQLAGDVQFTVYNNLGDRVEDATVRIFNNVIHQQIVAPETDINGEVTLYGLDIGKWTYQITAPGHSSVTGVVDITADQIVLVEDELDRSLITVSFNVVPVPFTDRYEIVIEQTFETRVPVPVLVVDPPYVEFKDVEPGFETTIIVTIKNEGLKALDNVQLETKDTGFARLEPLITYMPRLGAMQSVEVPYHLTYRGTAAELPPYGAGFCVDFLFNPMDALKGIAAIVKGSTNSYLSGAQKEAMGKLAAGLVGFGMGASDVAVTIGTFIGCLFASDNFGGDSSGPSGSSGPGSSGPVYATGNGGPGCFAAGTPVLMADGSRRPIETIAVGERVMTYDGNEGRVTDAYVRESDHVLELHYVTVNHAGIPELRRIETTDEHLFWSMADMKWVPARELSSGDVLSMPGRKQAEITEIWRGKTPITVYNIDVKDKDAYYVNDILVHQKCGGAEETVNELKIREFLYDQGGTPMPPAAADSAERGAK